MVQDWALFGAIELRMGEEILVGLAIAGSGRKTQRLAVASFDHVRLIRGQRAAAVAGGSG